MSIYKKLLLVKKELSAVKKDLKNPFYKNNYADINSYLEAVEPVLDKHGLLLLQPLLNDRVFTKIYDPESETEVTSSVALPDISDPQKLGGAITYYRRYTLGSLLAMQAEDDDGNSASGLAPKKETLAKPTSKPQSIYKYRVDKLMEKQEFANWLKVSGYEVDFQVLPSGEEIKFIASTEQIDALKAYLIK
jgi:hypothetical protein